MRVVLAFLVLGLFMAAVAVEPAAASCRDIDFVEAAVPRLGDDLDRASLVKAAKEGIGWLEGHSSTTLTMGKRRLPPSLVRKGLETMLRLAEKYPGNGKFLAEIKEYFVFYRPRVDKKSGLLVTGYYQPLFAASRRRSKEFNVPVYGLPSDLVRLKDGRIGRWRDGLLRPYPTRAEIVADGLPTAPVIAWMADPVERFIAQVQGSAVLRMPDGGELGIGFAGKNGHAYRSIGAYLVEKGCLARASVTMPAIIDFLARNPSLVRGILDYNPSFVFFRPSGTLPRGSLGTELVPGRSVALDSGCFPAAAPLFLSGRLPYVDGSGRMAGSRPMRRIVFHHDSGSAIKGPFRLDLFLGRGKAAAARAGVMRQGGELYVLLPREGWTEQEKLAAPATD